MTIVQAKCTEINIDVSLTSLSKTPIHVTVVGLRVVLEEPVSVHVNENLSYCLPPPSDKAIPSIIENALTHATFTLINTLVFIRFRGASPISRSPAMRVDVRFLRVCVLCECVYE